MRRMQRPSPPTAERRDIGAGLGCDAMEDGVISLAALPEAIPGKGLEAPQGK